MGSTDQLPREIDSLLSLQRRQAACPQGHGAAAAHPVDQGASADRRRLVPGHLPVAVANLGLPCRWGWACARSRRNSDLQKPAAPLFSSLIVF